MTDAQLPQTPEEWQWAVDAAQGFLAIEAARAYGFVTGGPRCNVARCEEILMLGKERGVTPSGTAVEDTVRALQP